jgi:DNA-3-methyladenine glycosylase II
MEVGPDGEIWPEGVRLLHADAAFAPVVAQSGPITMRSRGTHFEALTRMIVFQQLAGRAAGTIHARFVEAVGGAVRPETVLAGDQDLLRQAGLSRAKLRAIRDLASRVSDGTVPLGDLSERTDDEVAERLTRVRGIGRWTAQMFLMFQLRRPDVWPVGDLGVRKGWSRVHDLAEPQHPAELESLGDPYRPWRSVVAWYCYRAVEVLPPVG